MKSSLDWQEMGARIALLGIVTLLVVGTIVMFEAHALLGVAAVGLILVVAGLVLSAVD